MLFQRVKPLDKILETAEKKSLTRQLGAFQLTMLGIGAIIGTGIFVLTAAAAQKAGPGMMWSFVIAGAVCAVAALCYSEIAAMVPVSGSAYTYTYAVMGELLAWMVGWALILEYAVAASAVSVGWSGYFMGLVKSATGFELPAALAAGPHVEGGLINLPAIGITFVVAGALLVGTRESATVNALLVVLKLLALAVFVAVALPAFDPANLHPFMPYGFVKSLDAGGVERGVMAAAAIIFFAFYGFDAISTAAEETRDPGRNLSIGIVGSMVGCTLIYLLVALAAVGAMPFSVFGTSAEPLALILRELGHPSAALAIGVVAIVALPTVLLAFFYGQSRIFFVMSRDGLLPRGLSKVGPRGTPVAITVFTALLTAALAGVARLDEIAALANAGTLIAFTAVAVCLLVLRLRDPARPRVFRTPWAWLVGPLAILGCIYLFLSLPLRTQLWCLAWNGVGLLVYLAYARRHSLLRQGRDA